MNRALTPSWSSTALVASWWRTLRLKARRWLFSTLNPMAPADQVLKHMLAIHELENKK